MMRMAKKILTGVLIGMVATSGVALVAYALIAASDHCETSKLRGVIVECTVVLR
jgi:hypothetical protein